MTYLEVKEEYQEEVKFKKNRIKETEKNIKTFLIEFESVLKDCKFSTLPQENYFKIAVKYKRAVFHIDFLYLDRYYALKWYLMDLNLNVVDEGCEDRKAFNEFIDNFREYIKYLDSSEKEK